MTPDEAALEVAKAWDNAGPVPEYHRMMQLELVQKWPTLAFAVANLSKILHDADR